MTSATTAGRYPFEVSIPKSALRRAAKARREQQQRPANVLQAVLDREAEADRQAARRRRMAWLREYHRAGDVTDAQLTALERWAGDYHASGSVRSCLDVVEGRGGSGGSGLGPSALDAWRAFDDARWAILAKGELAEAVARRVAVEGKSYTQAVAELPRLRRRPQSAELMAEVRDLLRVAADALVGHYKHGA
jgi:hypothetical protein